MVLSCGIIGLPNIGKSTLFNALTLSKVGAENYPFCTIEPNTGIVEVPDHRLNELARIVKTNKIQPSIVKFIDIAGLVQGASAGEGLGNKFLNHIRETDAICHLVRCFENDTICHVNNNINPVRDIETIETELILSDLQICVNILEKIKKKTFKHSQDCKKIEEFYNIVFNHLNTGQCARTIKFNRDDLELKKIFKLAPLLSAKPTLFIANIGEYNSSLANNLHLNTVDSYLKKRNDKLLTINIKLEQEISQLTPNERKEFLIEAELKTFGLNELIKKTFSLLGAKSFLTAGAKEVRAWTIFEKTKAPQAGGVIHSDIERGFIKAEVIWWEDYLKYNGEIGCRSAGAMKLEGKEYIVKDGDVINFKFNV